MIRIFRNFKKIDCVLLFIAMLLISFEVWCDLKLPDYMSRITMLVQASNESINPILEAGGYMLLCALGSLVASVTVSILAAKVSTGFCANLRDRLFEKVMNFSIRDINKFATPSLITRSTNDITQLQIFILMGLQIIVKAPIMAIFGVIKIHSKHINWSTATAIAIFILVAVMLIALALVLPKFKKIQRYTDDLNRVTRENLTGVSVIRAYNAFDYQKNKFEFVNDNVARTNLFTSSILATVMPAVQATMRGLLLAIYWIGAYLVREAAIDLERAVIFSDMVVYAAYATQIVIAFVMLVMIFILLPRATVSANRILEVLEHEEDIKDNGDTLIDINANDDFPLIRYDDVSFSYFDEAKPAIKNINLEINKGETVAFIGSTGSGKTTVINLLMRFFDVTDGTIWVKGKDIRDYDLHSIRSIIGYVSQKAILYEGSIASNIAYSKVNKDLLKDSDISEALEKEIEEALDIAQATDFALEGNGIYQKVAQGGKNFSGGQKQRLSIARAVFKKPEIIIFDDSFSALDYATDRKLRMRLSEELKDITKIIVAQRIGTVREADRIYVIDEGEIKSVGTHSELMNNSDIYREIAYSQLSEEDMANER